MSANRTRSSARIAGRRSEVKKQVSRTSKQKPGHDDTTKEVPNKAVVTDKNPSPPQHGLDTNEEHFSINLDDRSIVCQRKGIGESKLIFTHGAGGDLSSPACLDFANGFAQHSSLVCFQGSMNMSSRVKYFKAVINSTTSAVLGGRSMGARAAVMARTDQPLILVSYPLVAKTIRDQILLDLPDIDVLFIIGTNDSMCPIESLNEVRRKMVARTWLLQVKDANHGMNTKPKSAGTSIRQATGLQAAKWLAQRPNGHDGLLEWKDESPHVQWQ